MNKKKLSIFLACLVLIQLLMFGCSGNGSSGAGNTGSSSKGQQKDTSSGKGLPPVKITLAGGSVGGSWAAIGEGIGEAIRRVAPGSAFGYQPGQDGANAITVNTGQTELGFLFSVMAKAAYEGNEPYKQKISDLRAIGTMGPLTYQMIVSEKSGIKTYADLKTKPVTLAVNTRDGTMELASRIVLEEHGITYEDIEKRGGIVLYLPSGNALDLIKDGRADGRTGITNAPEAKVNEAAATTKLVLVQPDPAAIERSIKRLGVTPKLIKNGTYPFQTADIPSFDVPITIVASKTLPDQVAYTVAKALVEQLPYLKTVVPKQLANDTPKSIVQANIPLHPGAEKFYREKGLIK